MEDFCNFYTAELEKLLAVGNGNSYLRGLQVLVEDKLDYTEPHSEQQKCLIDLKARIEDQIRKSNAPTFLGGSTI